MTRFNNILEAIGNTPLVKINKLASCVPAQIYVKMESFNPLHCVKERIALAMIEKAEKEGIISPGSTIIEPTSGNTGIGLAMVCAVKGYSLTLTMPDSVSIERRKILKALGAELILTPGAQGMKGAIAKADELAGTGKVFIPQQFKNIVNPEIHRKTTGVEIWKDLEGKVDVFVSAVGTGGTITGVGEVLREKNQNVYIIAVEPSGSPVLSGGQPGSHKIQGIGAGFVPDVLNTKIYNEIIKVENNEAYEAARNLAKKEGIFVGISSGAAFAAALKYAEREKKAENIVVLLADTGERYLSTELWDS